MIGQRIKTTAAVVLLLIAGAQATAQDAGRCEVTGVTGDVTLSAPGTPAYAAAPGLQLAPGTFVRTGAAARAAMICANGLDVVIGPRSAVRLEGILQGSGTPFGLNLLRGIAGFLFDRDGAAGVQIRTPSAVAAVRSTEWAMQVRDRASAIFARDGTVFVGTPTGSARLMPGEGVDVTASGEIGRVVRWGQGRIDRFGALLGPDW
jgi:hypothetical protein